MRTESKYVIRRSAVLLLAIGVLVMLFNATTPAECKVSIEKMSSWCKDIRFP